MWPEERSYEQDTGMGFILEMTHADGGRVEHQFRAESLDDVLMHVGYFVRGCGFVVQATDVLDFVPEDSNDHPVDADHDGDLPDLCSLNGDGSFSIKGTIVFREERIRYHGVYLPNLEMLDEIEVWYRGVEIYNLLADQADELIQRDADRIYRERVVQPLREARLRAEDHKDEYYAKHAD